jgi:hypothetical protein
MDAQVDANHAAPTQELAEIVDHSQVRSVGVRFDNDLELTWVIIFVVFVCVCVCVCVFCGGGGGGGGGSIRG